MAGQASVLWVAVVELLGQEKWQEAIDLAQEAQEKSRQTGVKATEASAATCLALAEQRNLQAVDALRELGATWSEAAVLATSPAELTATWAAAQGLLKASEAVRRLCQDLGLYWTETFEPRTAGHLISSSSEGELKEILVLKEQNRQEEALQKSTSAVQSFRAQGNMEGEASALLCQSSACLGCDNMAALQAANRALKLFRELGHMVGQAVALHAIAKVQLVKRNVDEALNRCAEALRLLRLLGDRGREAQVLCTASRAAVALGAARQALSFSLDALTTARKLQDRHLEADVLCCVAKARGACGEAMAASAAQEALAIYKAMDLKLQLRGLEALTACKGLGGAEARSCAEIMAKEFQGAGLVKEQTECLYLLAKMLHEMQDLDAALAQAEEALRICQDEGKAKVLGLLSSVHLDRKDFQEALDRAREASTQLGTPLDDAGKDLQLTCVNNQAMALAQLGNFSEALLFLEEKLRYFREKKEKRGEGHVLFLQAQLLQAKGSTEEALQRLALAAPSLVESRDRRGEALAWQLSAKIYLEKNELKKALPAAELSLQGFRKIGERRGRAQVAAVLAELKFSLCGLEAHEGNLEEARQAAKESVSLFHDLQEHSVELGYSLHCLANVNLALHLWEDALQSAQEALELFRSLELPLLETTALLLESGAYLGAQDYARSRERALEAKEIYSSANVLKGVDSVDQWLQQIERYSSGEQALKSFHGFSMRRKYNAPVSQGDERQSIRAPRQILPLNDIELIMAEGSQASLIISYIGLEHRQAGQGGQAAGKAKAPDLPNLPLRGFDETWDQDVRWVHRKSKSHSKGRRLQRAEEEKLAKVS